LPHSSSSSSTSRCGSIVNEQAGDEGHLHISGNWKNISDEALCVEWNKRAASG